MTPVGRLFRVNGYAPTMTGDPNQTPAIIRAIRRARPITAAARNAVARIIWLELAGFGAVATAVYMERPSAGIAVGGVSLLFIAYSLGD